ncbi:MAG TPA: hypothetical protein VM619_14870 [Luteimonas sp.]|nr:hypothetical protein [Luteimonas sp.]
MAFTVDGPKVWPITPDWKEDVRESLSWGTDVSQSSGTAATHHRSYRIGPRRGFSFSLTAWHQEHRVADALLAGYRGPWLLPIWPDGQALASVLADGSDSIPCQTAGFDFVAGGQALLHRAVNLWEVVDVESVEADHLVLGAETQATFGRGDRLYPLRRAWHQDGAEAQMSSDVASRRRLAFDVAEPCDWPVLTETEYLGYPVLTVRPDESDDPVNAYHGFRDAVDFGAALPVISDLPGITLRTQRDSWKLFGRTEHTWFRSLLYSRRGRQRPIWVPSWQSDLAPAAAIAGGSTMLSVEWAGYTLFGQGKPNRQDVRIELRDGTVHHRRITGAAEAGTVEMLTLDASLDAATIAPEQIRQISIMALATLASDTTEISHLTDAEGVATAQTGWQAVVPDV